MSLIRACYVSQLQHWSSPLSSAASPAWAQDPPPVVITGGLDLANQYNFRGIRQNTDGVSIWPYVDFGFTPYRGDGGLKTVGVNLGTWNAFNSQIDDFTDPTANYRQQVVRIRPLRHLGLGFGTTALGVHVYVVHEPGRTSSRTSRSWRSSCRTTTSAQLGTRRAQAVRDRGLRTR